LRRWLVEIDRAGSTSQLRLLLASSNSSTLAAAERASEALALAEGARVRNLRDEQARRQLVHRERPERANRGEAAGSEAQRVTARAIERLPGRIDRIGRIDRLLLRVAVDAEHRSGHQGVIDDRAGTESRRGARRESQDDGHDRGGHGEARVMPL